VQTVTHSRRSFLKSGATLAAASVAGRSGALSFSGNPVAMEAPLEQFGYGEVELLEGPLRAQFDRNHALFLALSEDSLLKPFRERAGLPAPGEDMGGWYDWYDGFTRENMHGFAPCHSFGQYVSGLARAYAATGNPATQAKVQRLVKGYAGAISPNFYVGHRFPAYTYDKISIGLIDAHTLAGDERAFAVLNATLDTVLPFLPPRALSRDEQYARPHKDETYCWDEPYTLAENFFLAYQRGAGSRYGTMAARYLADEWYFDPLARGENVLPGKHAYSHVNAMSSAMQAYLVLGSEKHLTAAKNGFEFLRTTQSFATGGWGPDEQFRPPASGEMGESLVKTHASFETPCGAYAHFKITRYLLRVTRDSRYGDSMERVLNNTILGAKPLKADGESFYYSDYNENARKGYHPQAWPCCSGTFPQITADYGISSYFHDGASVYVNLFVPSRVQWTRDGARIGLTQKTDYPYRRTTEIEVTVDNPRRFPVYLRIPEWAGAGTAIAVNGKRVGDGPEPGRFARLDRMWKNGDRIEMEFEMPKRLEAVDPQHPNVQALMEGPLALFSVGEQPASVKRQELLTAAQVSTGATDWQVKTATGTLKLRPFAAIGDETYRLYHNVEA
jgi:uncharacterized protein